MAHFTELSNMLWQYGRKIDRKKLANNTYLYRLNEEGDLAIRLHNTDIMVWHPEGSVTLDSGGWQTITTKDRMNRYLPGRFSIWQTKGVWYLHDREQDVTILYWDGMVVNENRGLPAPSSDTITMFEEDDKRKKMIDSYVKGLTDARLLTVLKGSAIGDCLFCQMEVQHANKVDGESHLVNHLEEKYYMQSLFYNALRYRGYRAEIYLGGMLYDAENGKETFWEKRTLKQALRKYFTDKVLVKHQGKV